MRIEPASHKKAENGALEMKTNYTSEEISGNNSVEFA